MRILITAINGDLGLSLARVISEIEGVEYVLGTDINTFCSSFGMVDDFQVLPAGSDVHYQAALEALIEKNAIDFVLFGSEIEIRAVRNFRCTDFLDVINRSLTKGDEALISFNKLLVYDYLKGLGINTPYTVPLSNRVQPQIPCVIKPTQGAGSVGVSIIRSYKDFKAIADQGTKDLLYQDYIDSDEEYTSAFIRLDEFQDLIVFRRILRGGVSVYVERVEDIEIISQLMEILALISIEGVLNIQFKIRDHRICIFEINPRLSSTVYLRHKMGFRDAEYLLRYRLGRMTGSTKFQLLPNKIGVKRYEEILF